MLTRCYTNSSYLLSLDGTLELKWNWERPIELNSDAKQAGVVCDPQALGMQRVRRMNRVL